MFNRLSPADSSGDRLVIEWLRRGVGHIGGKYVFAWAASASKYFHQDGPERPIGYLRPQTSTTSDCVLSFSSSASRSSSGNGQMRLISAVTSASESVAFSRAWR
jgi:hypothetical protein